MRLSFLVMTGPGVNTLKGTFWMCWDRCLQAVSRRGTFWNSSKSGPYRLFDEGEWPEGRAEGGGPAGEGRRRHRGRGRARQLRSSRQRTQQTGDRMSRSQGRQEPKSLGAAL